MPQLIHLIIEFKALQLGASGYIDKQSFETKFTEVFE
jgi:hypothetical protein